MPYGAEMDDNFNALADHQRRCARQCLVSTSGAQVDAHHYLQGHRQPLYRVRFCQADVWEGYPEGDQDEIEMEIVQSWLLPASQDELARQQKSRAKLHVHPRQAEWHHHAHSHGEAPSRTEPLNESTLHVSFQHTNKIAPYACRGTG